MTEKQMKSWLRVGHRWVGAVSAVFLLIAAGTGFLLQHPDWLGPEPEVRLAVALDPMDQGRLLRGTHWGVEQSRDGGETWTEIPMLMPPTDVVRIVFAPDDPRVVLALGRDALVVSRDGGVVWEEILVEAAAKDPGLVFRDLAAGSGGHLTLLADEGLLASSDDGSTWHWLDQEPDRDTADWGRLIHDLHTGHLAGAVGRKVAELGAVALVLIILTGLVLLRRNGKVFRP